VGRQRIRVWQAQAAGTEVVITPSCPDIAVPKNGVLKNAYVPGIHAFLEKKTWMAGTSPAMTIDLHGKQWTQAYSRNTSRTG
jgi:hypothetical protein